MILNEWLAFHGAFWISTEVITRLVPRETAAVSARSVYIIQPCTKPSRRNFTQSHKRRVYACLAVTCHLHVWHSDRDPLHTAEVTRGGTDTEIKVSTESWLWREESKYLFRPTWPKSAGWGVGGKGHSTVPTRNDFPTVPPSWRHPVDRPPSGGWGGLFGARWETPRLVRRWKRSFGSGLLPLCQPLAVHRKPEKDAAWRWAVFSLDHAGWRPAWSASLYLDGRSFSKSPFPTNCVLMCVIVSPLPETFLSRLFCRISFLRWLRDH